MPLNPFTKGGTDVPVLDGGTGASTAAGARTNLSALDETAHDLLDHSVTDAVATGEFASGGMTSALSWGQLATRCSSITPPAPTS